MDDADLAMERCVESVCGSFRGQVPAGTGIMMKAVYTEKLTDSISILLRSFCIVFLSLKTGIIIESFFYLTRSFYLIIQPYLQSYKQFLLSL